MIHNISFQKNNCEAGFRCIWLTDLHLDSVETDAIDEFLIRIDSASPDALLIGGDIANGVQSFDYLQAIAKKCGVPIYFVLGNHDFYHSSIGKVRDQASSLSTTDGRLNYLTTSQVVSITKHTALIGHDGWSDGMAGDFFNSDVILNDYLHIRDLNTLSKDELKKCLENLGKEAALNLKIVLQEALATHQQVLILTHSPPFEEVCLYEGKQTNENWAPHFVCQVVGKMLRDVVPSYPDREVIVLCGHSHHKAKSQILPDLIVYTGHSELGSLFIQGIITVE